MKTLIPHSAGHLSRLLGAGLVAIAIAATAVAAPTAVVKLARKEFGNAKNLHAVSKGKVTASESFSYVISGTCGGTGQLAGLVPRGTPFATFMDSIRPGSSALLRGTLPNPTGKLPATLINRKFSGRINDPRLGKITVSGRLSGRILADGTAVLDVRQIRLRTPSGKPKGTIRFDAGAKLVVTAAAIITCKANGVKVREGAGSVKVKVIRRINTRGSHRVRYSTADGTATAGSHYTAVSGLLTFARGETEKTVTIPIGDDSSPNRFRKFTLNLSRPGPKAAIGNRKSTIVTILDND